MSSIAIKKAVKDGLTVAQWNQIKTLPDNVTLGNGPLQTDGVDEFYLYDDNRFTLQDVGRICAFLANLAGILVGDLSAIVSGAKWTVPPDAGEQDDPFAYTLEQNGGTDLMLAGQSLPQLHDIEE